MVIVVIPGRCSELRKAHATRSWTLFMCEIRTPETAKAVLEHYQPVDVGMSSHMVSCDRPHWLLDVLTLLWEGAPFISSKSPMPWK